MPPEEAWTVRTDSQTETMELAAGIGRAARPGDLIVLNGPLGAGKTTFVQGLAAGLDIPPVEVTSPTFTLLHEYRGRLSLYHFDAYRLASPEEFVALDPWDYLEGDGVCAVEWGTFVSDTLPPDHLEVRLALLPAAGIEARLLTLVPHGPRAAEVLTEARRTWSGRQGRHGGGGTG